MGELLKSRWLAGSIHAALWLLVYWAVIGLGGKDPDFHETDSLSSTPICPAPVARAEQLLLVETWKPPTSDTNSLSPFLTTYFIPIPAPPPPAATTRTLELTYQGFYETANGPRRAIVKLGEGFLICPVGTKVVSNLFAAEVTMQTLTLTNTAAQTNLLPVNTKKEVEVPIR